MAFTRKTIRQRIGSAEFAADTFVSAATSTGTTTTLIDTSLKQPDDFFISSEIITLEGLAVGARYVTDWVQSTSTFTVDRVWAGASVSGDDYEVHTLFSYTEKNEAIVAAQRAAGMRWARRIEDTSLTFLTNTYTYSLGSLTVPIDPDIGLDKVMYDTGTTGTGVPYATLDDDLWELRISGTTYTLQVHDIPRVGATIRLVYRVRPTVVSDDTTSVVPDSIAYFNYLSAKATAILYRSRSLIEPASDWAAKADYMDAMAEGFWNLDKPQSQGGKVRYPIMSRRDDDYLPIDFGL
jgi:hypothetical protein